MDLTRKDFRLLAEHRYDKGAVHKGYNDRTLHVDVGSRKVTEKPVPAEMKATLRECPVTTACASSLRK